MSFVVLFSDQSSLWETEKKREEGRKKEEGNSGKMATPANESMPGEDARAIDIVTHGHRDVVQAIAFNAYGDRCATGSVDGKIRVFNRHKDGTWRMCDHWGAHGGEILEVGIFFFCLFFPFRFRSWLMNQAGFRYSRLRALC